MWVFFLVVFGIWYARYCWNKDSTLKQTVTPLSKDPHLCPFPFIEPDIHSAWRCPTCDRLWWGSKKFQHWVQAPRTINLWAKAARF